MVATVLNQQVKATGDKTIAFAYGRAITVGAGESVTPVAFTLPVVNAHMVLRLGLGVSDLAAWDNDSYFVVNVAGREFMTITDQIGDLLRPVEIPIVAATNELVEVDFYNDAASPIVDVAITCVVA